MHFDHQAPANVMCPLNKKRWLLIGNVINPFFFRAGARCMGTRINKAYKTVES
jgi:hypothetical protein